MIKNITIIVFLLCTISNSAQVNKDNKPKDGWHQVDVKITCTYPLRIDRLKLWTRIENKEIIVLSEFKTDNAASKSNILLDENIMNLPVLKYKKKRKGRVIWFAEFKVLNNERNIRRNVRNGPNTLGGGSASSKVSYTEYLIKFK